MAACNPRRPGNPTAGENSVVWLGVLAVRSRGLMRNVSR